jgi:hypothetical protein
MPPAELTKFYRSLQTIDVTRTRMEKLFRDGKITKNDLNSVYEALFLRAVTSFESFLEELFLAILEGRVRYKRGMVKLRMSVKSPDALMDILLQGEKYMSWLPFRHTEDRARIYLGGGRPFCDLSDGDRSIIKTITTIRHAIAHRSAHAMGEFQRTVIRSQSLLRGERMPAGYLRSQLRSGTIQNRFEVYIGELGRVAAALC